MNTLLFDIGGTNLRMATGKSDCVENVQKVQTPADPMDAVALLSAYAKENIPECKSASGGIAGSIENGIVHTSAHLPEWKEFNFAAVLGEALSVPVVICNDAEAAGVGEAVYGAGKGHSLVAYVGIGTGVGGSYIANGKPVPHAGSFEPGHQILDIETGETFEQLVSGSGLEKQFGKSAKELSREVYRERTSALATGLYNVILDWSPEIVVLGGSLVNEENGYRIADIKQALGAIPSVVQNLPSITRAALGDESGLYGALALS